MVKVLKKRKTSVKRNKICQCDSRLNSTGVVLIW